MTMSAEAKKAYMRAYRATHVEAMRLSVRNSMRRRRLDPKKRAEEKKWRAAYRAQHLEEVRLKERKLAQDKQACLNALKKNPCTDCLRDYPACCMDFDHVRGTKVKGIGQLMSCSQERLMAEIAKCDLVCACCHRVRTHPRRQDSKNRHRVRFYAKIDAIKDSKPCLDCGRILPPVAMDFDHIKAGKVATVAQLRSVSWAKVLAEIAKCELVCANCHRIRTWARRHKGAHE